MDPRKFCGGIHNIIQDIPDGSTDEDLSEDEDRVRRARTKRPIVIPELEEESEFEAEDDIPLVEIAGPSSRAARAEKSRWKDGFLEKADTELEFSGNVSLPPDIMELETPIQFYKYLFADDMFEYIAQQTLLYAAEKRPEKIPKVTTKDIEKFIGVCFMMSIIQLPSIRDYWNETSVGAFHPCVSHSCGIIRVHIVCFWNPSPLMSVYSLYREGGGGFESHID